MDNSALLGNYLKQQSSIAGGSKAPSAIGDNDSSLAVPENITLEDFKEYVRKYIELDTWIKKAAEILREKKKNRDKLSETITKFMIRYDIEDLNVSNAGKIRCKIRQVKQACSQKIIKEKITDYFKEDTNQCREIIQKVFNERPVVEKASLRRIKIT
jgi:hypothetical protein